MEAIRGSKLFKARAPGDAAEIANILPSDLTLVSTAQIASLWSNYGHIYRLTVSELPDENASSPVATPTTLILKSIHPPSTRDPSESRIRKLLSYEIERWFYHNLASRVPPSSKLARVYPTTGAGELLLEDLAVDYPHPARGSLGLEATQCVLRWLAGFHAAFWGVQRDAADGAVPLVPPPSRVPVGADVDEAGQGVWEQGTYWYLDTRREELAKVDEAEYWWLMPWVEKVNDALTKARTAHSTLLHGDVKGANTVFSHPPDRCQLSTSSSPPLRCALYDLQYVGVGVPTHDLVKFLGNSVDSSLLTPSGESSLLAFYHDCLVESIGDDKYSKETFLQHWELSVVDWFRFMTGWGFWGNDQWAARRAKEVVDAWEAGEWDHS